MRNKSLFPVLFRLCDSPACVPASRHHRRRHALAGLENRRLFICSTLNRKALSPFYFWKIQIILRVSDMISFASLCAPPGGAAKTCRSVRRQEGREKGRGKRSKTRPASFEKSRSEKDDSEKWNLGECPTPSLPLCLSFNKNVC